MKKNLTFSMTFSSVISCTAELNTYLSNIYTYRSGVGKHLETLNGAHTLILCEVAFDVVILCRNLGPLFPQQQQHAPPIQKYSP